MKKLSLFGGGRWARVLMSVLVDILPEQWRIVWVTKIGHEVATKWCNDRDENRIEVVHELSDTSLTGIDAAIVATAPHLHSEVLWRTIAAGIPTLCEKPLVLDIHQSEEFEKLALERNCPLGVNLQLTFASFLEEFAAVSQEIGVKSIEVVWKDPWSEERYGEQKHGDVHTNIVEDMLPHCWTLLAAVSGLNDWQILDVNYTSNTDVLLDLIAGSVLAKVTLGRRAQCRHRKVSINQDEAFLDFSYEPGHIGLRSFPHGLQRYDLKWKTERPLRRSLESFLKIADSKAQWTDWPLSIVACSQSIRLCSVASQMLLARRTAMLRNYVNDVGCSSKDFRERLILDTYLPIAARQNWRLDIRNELEIQNFIKFVETQLGTGIDSAAIEFPFR